MSTNDLGSFLDEMHEEYRDDPEYRAECLYNDITAEILDYMDENDITRRELARKMDVSEARVSRIFGETQNFTLQMLGKMASALGVDIGVHMERASSLPDHLTERDEKDWQPAKKCAEQRDQFDQARSTTPWKPWTEEKAIEGQRIPVAA